MPNKDTLVTVQVNPGRDKPANETTWEDNKDSAMIQLAAMPAPGNGQLTLTAISQGGDDIYGNYIPQQQRPAGTAKWTDTVTATLKPPKPSPPKGKITSWSVTSAKLTYPERHPDFTFGHPLQPVSNITKTMTTQGHQAVTEFIQDWSINGYAYGTGAAGIYDHIEGRIVSENPKKYPITASYKVKFTYEYKVRKCSGSGENRSCHTVTRTGSGTDSGTAFANLQVNGASRVPLAH